MGEIKGKSRKGSGGNIILILTGILMLAVTVTAVYIALHIGATFKEYRTGASELRTVREELRTAQKERDAKLEKKRGMEVGGKEIDDLRSETFALAAQLENDIRAGRNDNRICYLTIDDGDRKSVV